MRIGIDLGGTKTEIIVLGDDGATLLRERAPTPRGDYAATVATIASLVRRAEQKLGVGGTAPPIPVGIGIPGAESRVSGLIKNANSTWLIGKPLRADLEAALSRPVRLANDANCFALSEATDGAAAGATVVFGVILGTGVGGGIVVEGKVLVGPNAIAGEWGHNPLPGASEGRPCYCGRQDCIETYLSGPALALDGGADDEAALERYERRLARALAGVINLLDPDVIVLGGGVSNLDRLYDRVPRLWREWVFSDHVATRLLKNRHGDSSGVRGAAWLWG
ncbi:ROK family protein [Sulfuricystis multivorans]|uniref:ROK family protein n=1 Tax=Sulfuricystis multivorans TaxID=2211108 RepID=UPI000F81EFA5|nr:ROK family protein [Sulfuricystis multivorans]